MKFHNFLGHLLTVLHHKRLVLKGCFQVGLYWQGMTHDLSKFSPSEFLIGVKYYQGDRSPNNAEREVTGYSSAWLHHKGRNKHHYEFWIDYSTKEIEGGMKPAPMPRRYVVEMFMDRIAASKTYLKDKYDVTCPLQYYTQGKSPLLLHSQTAAQLETLLKMLAKQGEEKTFSYIRNHILKKRNTFLSVFKKDNQTL